MNKNPLWRLSVLVSLLTVAGCSNQPPPATGDGSSPAELAPTPGKPWFEDATAQAGIDFVHFDSATDKHYLPEVMGSGLGFIDYDADGWIDLFCVQAGPLPGGAAPRSLPTHQ